jgi:radical SAM superfamily enzyme YgiQ (UPF0313 family)
MAKVIFVVFYDDVALGLTSMANLLIGKGHQAEKIHFKLPIAKPIKRHKKQPRNVEFIDSQGILHGNAIDVAQWTKAEEQALLNLINDRRPDIIGISSRSNFDDEVIRLCAKIRPAFNAIIIAGGFGPTYNPNGYLKECDYVCIGEGENTISMLAETMGNRDTIRKIPNLAYKDQGQTIRNSMEIACETCLLHTDCYEVPSWVVENDEIRPFRGTHACDSEYCIMAGRGCVNNCVYCTTGQWYRIYRENGIPIKRRRNRQIFEIIDELLMIRDKYPRIHFIDPFLFGTQDFLKELFEQYRKKINLPFVAQLNYLQCLRHPEIIESACQAGLCQTVIGVQSASEKVRTSIFLRKETDEVLMEFAELMDHYAIIKDFHIISHNPYESEDEIESGYEFLRKLSSKNSNIDFMRLQILKGSLLKKNGHLPRFERTLEENDKIIYKQMARLYGNDKQFRELAHLLDHQPTSQYRKLFGKYPNIFKPYKSGYQKISIAKA